LGFGAGEGAEEGGVAFEADGAVDAGDGLQPGGAGDLFAGVVEEVEGVGAEDGEVGLTGEEFGFAIGAEGEGVEAGEVVDAVDFAHRDLDLGDGGFVGIEGHGD
jgi:hypothetical protein